MTPDQPRARWLVADPETGTLIEPNWSVAIDLDRLTPEQIDDATDASELDDIPADVLAESVSLAALLADGLRWRAWMSTPYGNSHYTRGNTYTTPDEGIRCPACELAENRTRYIDIRTAVVVPWDVMGDPRAYALVCPECAEVTPEPAPVPTCDNCQTVTQNLVFRYRHCTIGDGLEHIETLCEECHDATGDEVNTPAATPNPGHVCDTCGTETPAIWWHYHVTGDGTPDKGRRYCGPCWDNLPGDKVNP